MKRNYKTRSFELRTNINDNTLVGYAAVFNELSEPMDGFREKIAPGAFRDSLAKNPDVKALFNHDMNQILGRTTSGTLRLNEDSKGLRVEIDLPSTQLGQDVKQLVKRGDLNQMSFGFNLLADDWDGNEFEPVRILKKVDLIDVSLVTMPAYIGTSAQIRSKNIMTIDELIEKRNKIWAVMRRLNDNPKMTAEDTQEYEKAEKDFEEYTRKINFKRNEQMLAQPVNVAEKPIPAHQERARAEKVKLDDNWRVQVFAPGTFKGIETRTADIDNADLRAYFTKGRAGLTDAQHARFDQRALQVDRDVQGGFLVANESFTNDCLVQLNDLVWMRSYATIVILKYAQSLGVPYLENDPADPDWTSEIATGTEDTTMSLQKRALYPHPLAKRILVSNTLLQRNPKAEQLVRDRLMYKFSTTEETAFWQGDGANKALGCMIASDQGISTARDMSDGNTSGAIKGDNLVNCKYHLAPAHRKNARWVFSTSALKQILKLKTGTGEYVWSPGLVSGTPDRILGMPYHESSFFPDSFSANQYVGILGDFGYYYIVDALNMQIQALVELYSESNRTGFIGRKETDGAPVLEEAFVRVQLGS
jgi:HK97 family phage major capsid protein/HK97 family phage prohead protease